MARLHQNPNGSYSARKRLPDDVREDYGRVYGQHYEVKFSAPASTKRHDAERLFHEWKAETDARIGTIRARRKGDGVSLTRQQTRALAGEWYHWFMRATLSPIDRNGSAYATTFMKPCVRPLAMTYGTPTIPTISGGTMRTSGRPVLADAGETSQFLTMKGLVLNNETRDQFLDFLYDDLSAALKRLMRQADGDYSPDKYSERFPKFEGADKGQTPVQLFDQWVNERKPSQGTVESWQYVFREMEAHFKGRSASSIRPDEAQQWIRSLVTEERSAHVVRRTWLGASKAVFGWAAEHKHLPRNAFQHVKITVPKSIKLRETPAFYPEEQRIILGASLRIAGVTKPDEAAKRWIPWLCAYTGARVGELAQLRKEDVIERDGIRAIRITPEAGTVKSRQTRVVPLHEHLTAQGFLKFASEHAEGPRAG
jgi:integrase